jgi:lipoprotein-releasing system permease protein
MKTYLWIASRYLINFRREKFVSLMTLVSVLGVAIGVMTLIIVIAVMSGFDRDLKSKILGLNYDMTIDYESGVVSDDPLFAKLSTVAEVENFSTFVAGQALLASPERFIGVHLRGVDLAKEMKLNDIARYIYIGALPIGQGQLVIGEELSRQLNLSLSDNVSIFSPVTNKHYPFTIAGVFKSGYYEYDLNLVFTTISDAQKVMLMDGLYSGVGIKAKNNSNLAALRDKLQAILGPDYRVRAWTDLNRTFFAALKLEKITMFIILTLIVLVAAFNIISTLTVLVSEKTKDIGILKSIGISAKGISSIFMIEGILIGALGIALGTSLGVLLCTLLARYQFIRLPQDIYYIQYLPVYLRLQEVGLIALAAFFICLCFTIYPARKAASLEPVEALRYE